MEEIVVYSEKFHHSIEELLEVLYENEYFGFMDDCVMYTEKIYDFVDLNISKPVSKNTPEPFQKYGRKFLRYKANQRTSWYIFFDQRGNRFLINHVMNNHSQDFPGLL